MTKLSGYLEDAFGIAIPNCTIELRAQKTTLSVITKTSAFSAPNGEGYYEMEVKPGQYLVTLLMDGYSPKQVGEITIYFDSLDGTLNDFLLVPNSDEIKPELITALEQVRYENQQIVEKAKQEVKQLAQHTQDIAIQTEQNIQHIAEQTTGEINKSAQLAIDAKNAAEQAKNEAQNSLANVVKKSGDVIRGNLDFNGAGSAVSFSHNDDKHYIYEDSSGNLVFELKGSDEPKIRLQWNKETNTWGFNNCNVTKNNVDMLSTGDFGLGARSPLLPAGTDFSSDLVTSSNNEFTLSGKYIGTPDDSKVWGGTLTVKRRLYDENGGCTLILFCEGSCYIKYGSKNAAVWNWSKWEQIILSSGGTLTGDLNIQKGTLATLSLTTNNQNKFKTDLFCNHTFGIATDNGAGITTTKLRFTPDADKKNGVWNFENSRVTLDGVPLLKQGDAIDKKLIGNIGITPRYALLAEGIAAGNNPGNLTLLVSGMGNYGGQIQQTDIVSFSTRSGGNLVVTNLVATDNSPSDYGIEKTNDGKFRLWMKTSAYIASVGVSKISGESSNVIVDISQSIALQTAEPANIQYVSSKSVLKTGDYGFGASLYYIDDMNDTDKNMPTQIAYVRGGATSGTPLGSDTALIHIRGNEARAWQIALENWGNGHLCYRFRNNSPFSNWISVMTNRNTTTDANGFLKKASPIVRLINPNDQIAQEACKEDSFYYSGDSYVNEEAKEAVIKYLSIGHYEIHGSLGFAKKGWYIETPEDSNGNKKLFTEYSADENNVLTVKTYTRKFDIEKCVVVAGEPMDIPEGRWIDLRLEMPVLEHIEDEISEVAELN